MDVLEVVQTLERRGLHTPLLLRFPDILAHRVRLLQVRRLATAQRQVLQTSGLGSVRRPGGDPVA